jgi:hypothetical protein
MTAPEDLAIRLALKVVLVISDVHVYIVRIGLPVLIIVAQIPVPCVQRGAVQLVLLKVVCMVQHPCILSVIYKQV